MKVTVTPAETKVVFLVVKPQTISLELTQEEVDLIVVLTGRVGGSGNARKITDKIYYGLKPYSFESKSSSQLEEKYNIQHKGGMYSN